MKPESAMIPAGEGRPLPRPSAYDITAPCEKPPMTVRSIGTPVRSGSPSNHAVSCPNVAWNVSLSGKPIERTTYQCAPPGGSESGPRG